MRGRLAVLGGALAVAGAALYRALRPRRVSVAEAQPSPDPRAEELREKLAEARSVVAEREEFEAAETPVDQAAAVADDVAERRRKLHAEGRAAAGQMRRRRKPDATEE